MKHVSTYFILFFTIVSRLAFSQNPGDSLFSSPVVHDINISFTQAAWWNLLMYNKLHADSFNLSTEPIMGNVTIDGVLIDSVGVKLKGNSSFGYPGQKKSIKLEFNEYVSGKKYNGLKSINLNNNTLDPSFMREKLMLDYLNSKGLAAPRCTYARVSYNGQYVGLYKIVEQVDKTFLKTHFGNKGGNLFKGDPGGSLIWMGNMPSAYYGSYELHTNEVANDWTDLVNFINNINNIPSTNFEDTLETNLNTAPFIKQWAAENLFVDLDSYFHSTHNYYLYHNTATNKFEWITWDVSVSFGFYPGMSELQTQSTDILMDTSILTGKMLANTTYKTDYLNTLCLYLDDFTNDAIDPKIDSIAAVIFPHIVAEPDSNQAFPEQIFYACLDSMTVIGGNGVFQIPGLKRFIANRRANVLSQLASIPFTCTNGISGVKNSEKEIVIYPNPFSVETTIEIPPDLKNSILTIYNVFGQQVRQITIGSELQVKIHRGNLENGVYFARIIQLNKTTATTRFIITD